MMIDDPLVICFLPSVFNPMSNGHFIYLDFCASLVGEVSNIVFISSDSRYAHGEIGRQSYARYKERFAGLYITEQDFATLLTPDLTQKMWLVLPDHIEGLESVLVHFLRDDPLVIGCINVMLAPAYALAANSTASMVKEDYSYKQGRDYFVFYLAAYSNNVCREGLYIEPLPGDITPIRRSGLNTATKGIGARQVISFYLGKGLVRYSEEVRRVMEDLKTLEAGIEPVLITRDPTTVGSTVSYQLVLRNTGTAVLTDVDVADSFDTATLVTSAANGTSGIVTVAEITATAIDSLVVGDTFRIKIYRDADDATNDTMTGDAELIAVEVQQVA